MIKKENKKTNKQKEDNIIISPIKIINHLRKKEKV